MLPFHLYKKTIAYNILSGHPYDKIHWLTTPTEYIKDMLTSSQMLKLKYFDKYIVAKPDDSSKTKNILIV